jgi:large subunit ribosomal protein L4
MDVPVVTIEGKPAGKIALADEVWGGEVNLPLLSQAVAMYRTNVRAGTASTKTRAYVSGGGKKPWKQKHTGRARAGSSRSPLWRHGGSVFGPRPRDMSYRLPQTIRRTALLESLKGKLRDQELVVVNELAASTTKTKPFAGLAKTFSVERRSVIVLEENRQPVVKSLRNLSAFNLRQASNLNAFDVLNSHKLIVTKRAFELLQQRVQEPDAIAK